MTATTLPNMSNAKCYYAANEEFFDKNIDELMNSSADKEHSFIQQHVHL